MVQRKKNIQLRSLLIERGDGGMRSDREWRLKTERERVEWRGREGEGREGGKKNCAKRKSVTKAIIVLWENRHKR